MGYSAEFCQGKVKNWVISLENIQESINKNISKMDKDFKNAKEKDALDGIIDDMNSKIDSAISDINSYTFK